jgi:hypothetical protein
MLSDIQNTAHGILETQLLTLSEWQCMFTAPWWFVTVCMSYTRQQKIGSRQTVGFTVIRVTLEILY